MKMCAIVAILLALLGGFSELAWWGCMFSYASLLETFGTSIFWVPRSLNLLGLLCFTLAQVILGIGVVIGSQRGSTAS